MSNRKTWITLGLGAVAAVLVTRELAGTRERRERLSGKLQEGVGRVKHAGEELLHEGEDYVKTLRGEAMSLRSAVADTVQPDHERKNRDQSASNHESAIVAFMATVLVKGVSSYLQWRGTEKARSHSSGKGRSAGAEDRDPADMTVVELRKEASSQNIDGRSTMNKQELVSALEE